MRTTTKSLISIAAALAVAASAAASRASSAAPATAPTLAAAFVAVYPHATVVIDNQHVQFSPSSIERVGPDTFALVSAGQIPMSEAGHVTFGYATIAYLKAGPKLTLMAKPFEVHLSRGGFGAPPTIQAEAGISKTPTIAFISSYGNQGIFDTTATLVALGPTPDTIKYVSDPIALMHTNQSCDIHGEIVAVTPDKAFNVQFSGAYRGHDRYVFTKGKWTPSGAQADLEDLCDG